MFQQIGASRVACCPGGPPSAAGAVRPTYCHGHNG